MLPNLCGQNFGKKYSVDYYIVAYNYLVITFICVYLAYPPVRLVALHNQSDLSNYYVRVGLVKKSMLSR